MQEIIFKPRYSTSYWLEILLLSFWTFMLGASYFYGNQLLSWSLLALIIVAGTVFFRFSYMIRRILFQQNAIVIEYYFRPRREIEYQEISDISEYAFLAGKSQLTPTEFSNRTELMGIANSLKKSGRIVESQLKGQLKKNEEITRTAGIIAILGTIIIILTVPFILRIWFPEIEFSIATILGASLVGIFLIVFAVLKIIASRQPKP